MKKLLKKQNGIAAIAIVLIVVLTVAVGGVTFLGIKSLVTGEPFLQPFEDLGLIELEEENDEESEEKADKDDKKEDEDVVDEDELISEEKDEETTDDSIKNSNLSEEAQSKGVIHYRGEINFEDYMGDNTIEYSDLIEMSADIYATDTEIVEIVFVYNLKQFLEEYYNEFESDMVSAGFDTYDSFRDEMMNTFETSFSSGFASSGGSEISDYFDIYYPEKEIIEMHITEGGIDQLYENYGIQEGDSIQDILDGFESALNIELKKI